MNLAMCEVPVHPVQFLSVAELEALPELVMTQDSDGTYYCDGESIQDGTPSPDNPVPIVNTYPADTYKAICGDKTYKVTLDDDLRSVPGVADRVRIDAGKGVCWVERKVVQKYFSEFNNIQFEREKENTIVFNTTNNIPKPSEKECLCTHFTAQKDGDVPTIKILPEYHTTIYFALYKTDASTLEELKTWIAENNPYLLYCIAPTTHQSVPTQLTTISSGRSVTIPNTVNDAVDMLAVKGDSWQLVQKEITDEEGNVTQPTMPSPEYPSEIVSVDGEMGSCGWNIADITGFSATVGNVNELTNNYGTKISTTEPTNKLIVTQTPNNDYGASSFYNGYVIVKLKNKMIAGRKYIVSFDIDITANPLNADFILIMANGIDGFRIKLQENGKHRATVIWNAYSSRNYLEIRCMGMSFILSNIQITEETQERPYDRHRGNSITLPVLRSLPDGTADVLHVDRAAKRAWVERCVGVVEFDGSEDEDWGAVSTGYYVVIKGAVRKNHAPICNRYNGYAYAGVYIDNKVCINYNSAFVLLDSNNLSGMSEEDLKAWLSQNPLTVHYQLKEPTIEELPYSDYLLQTAQYETNIHIDCDEHLEPEISAKVKVLGR